MDQTCPTLAQKAHLKHVICVQAPLLSTPNASVFEAVRMHLIPFSARPGRASTCHAASWLLGHYFSECLRFRREPAVSTHVIRGVSASTTHSISVSGRWIWNLRSWMRSAQARIASFSIRSSSSPERKLLSSPLSSLHFFEEARVVWLPYVATLSL